MTQISTKRCLAPFFLALVALSTSQAFAWSEHHRITRQALLALPELAGKTVVVTPFQAVLDRKQQLLWEVGYREGQGFNETLQIRKEYPFAFHAGEEVGKPISAIEVLSVYSDEPDWKMDTELFDADQYPELWRPEYSMMGGRVGTASQSFRHMYWRSLNFREALATFHLPPSMLFKSMGTAPDRGAMFVALSRAAWAIPGLEYWALRFLGASLHYLEDVSQPYHSSQLTTPKFLAMVFLDRARGTGSHELVKQVQNILSYYHFAYEDYVTYQMKQAGDAAATEEARALLAALTLTPPAREFKGLEYSDRDPRKLIAKMSKTAVGRAGEAGNACLKFFPEIQGKFADLDANAFMNEAWWAQVIANGRSDSEAKRAYFGTVEPMFTLVGEAIRRLVSAELRLK